MDLKTKLIDIAEIYSGYTFRESIDKLEKGAVPVLQAKDIKQGEPILSTSELKSVAFDLSRGKSYATYNDVLLVSRAIGAGGFRSSIFKSKKEGVIVSSTLFIIRPKDERVLPEYLSLYLNSTEGQNDISKNLSGSSVQILTIKKLEELKIPMPPIDKQKTIIALHENIKKQEEIFKKKIKINKEIINETFRRLNK